MNMNMVPVTKDSLIASLESLKSAKVPILGDVMLDRYIMGRVDRISPEAPVPVVLTQSENMLLGGAGNVARNIKSLDGIPLLFSVCGRDRESDYLDLSLESEQIQAFLVTDPKRPTTTKTRIIAHNQQIVRIDRESVHPITPALAESIVTDLFAQVDSDTVIVVSDYNKGMITDQIMHLIANRLREYPGIRLLVDPKPTNFNLFQQSYLLTPNAKEAKQVAGKSSFNSSRDIVSAGLELKCRFQLDNLLITLGQDGMVLFSEIDKIWHIPAMSQTVYDVTGAGDTVIATLGLCLASGLPLLEACMLANYAAGIVVGEVGAAVVDRDSLVKAINRWSFPVVSDWTIYAR